MFLHYKEINIEDETLNQLNNLANELTKKNIPSEFLEEQLIDVDEIKEEASTIEESVEDDLAEQLSE